MKTTQVYCLPGGIMQGHYALRNLLQKITNEIAEACPEIGLKMVSEPNQITPTNYDRTQVYWSFDRALDRQLFVATDAKLTEVCHSLPVPIHDH